MKHPSYNEQKERGDFIFPAEYYYVTNHHPRYHMPYHWHLQYEIIRIIKGKITISIDENEYTACEGDIIFIPDGAVHGGKAFSEDTIYEDLVFDKKFFDVNIGNKDFFQKFLDHNIILYNYLSKEKYPYIHQVVWNMFEILKNHVNGYEYIVQGSLLIFLGLMFKHNLYTENFTNFANSNQRNIYKLKKVFKLIETSYNKPLTLDDLASASGLSSKYFCRFFQSMTSKTPISYLNYYRVECACTKLINERDLSITDVAYSCGFNDLSYFIKTFRKYKNTTPNKYLTEYLSCNNNEN